MNETFVHNFGTMTEETATRWINPNGSAGGIVATTAKIHSSATIDYTAVVAPHAEIGQNCMIHGDVRIGSYAYIGSYCEIGYRSFISDEVFIGTHSHIYGHVNIGYRTTIGAEVHIKSYTDIGDYAVIYPRSQIDSFSRFADHVEFHHDDWMVVHGTVGPISHWVTAVYNDRTGLRFWIGKGFLSNVSEDDLMQILFTDPYFDDELRCVIRFICMQKMIVKSKRDGKTDV